ncbi:TPR-like protein [Obba rivulosa]|uniref:TPR-like protein n=1 Tax=Obba rivulosa TaxID=1052685 RepID=A0A8E2DFG0_9APHY|nr:TPR-like protein [Obba rivulosa]
MSLRHTPRQSERDVRLHDPHPAHAHAHSLPPPAHTHGHPAHMNGNGLPTPPVGGPAAHASAVAQMVSPPGLAQVAPNGVVIPPSIQKLAQANEQTWLLIGRVAEQMGNLEHALSAYENALRHNPMSLAGLTQVAGIARIKENYPKAVEYFQRVLSMQQDNGEVWSALGHCYLMQDDLQKAYAAYQQALYLLPNPKKDPKLWYGIGILYDRYGSLDHAEEAFASVLEMDKDFDKANEILFRLGIIYKQQGKYDQSLECFDRILRNPPNPLAHGDIWFQIGHVFEQQRDHERARDAYERVVMENPNHAKVLQQLGWLYHQDGSGFQNQDLAIQYLTKSLEADPSDAQSWYLLGRAYMAGQKYNKAYEAYQQAVYRDGRNPTFWCSIGVLYFQINQFRDALDAYSRAIRINPYISEVWFDLGSLYESCNNQISDAIDAYARAAELDPNNTAIAQRLQLLKNAQATGSSLPAAPGPQDVHPTAYANPMMIPPGLSGPPMMMPVGGARPIFRTDSRGPPGDLPVPLHAQQHPGRNSPGPFRGGPPPPVVLDDSRHVPSHTPLAPMDVDRPPVHSREPSNSYPPPPRDIRDGPRGPAGQGLILQHPLPQPSEVLRGSYPPTHPHEAGLGRPLRIPSSSASPAPHSARPRSPLGHAMPYDARSLGPGQTPGRRSPMPYPRDVMMAEREPGWFSPDRSMDWEARRGRPGADYPPHGAPYYAGQRPHSPPIPQRGPSPRGPRERSPDIPSKSAHAYRGSYYDQAGRVPGRAPSPAMHEQAARRYDPRFDAREPPREYDQEMVDRRVDPRAYTTSEAMRMRNGGPPTPYEMRASASPRMAQQGLPVEPKDRRRRNGKDKDSESVSSAGGADAPKKERKRRAGVKRVKEEPMRVETPASYTGPTPHASSFKLDRGGAKSNGSPEPVSSASGSAGRSVQPSPTNSTHIPPSRVVDEDYDEGVADALMGLSAYRGSESRAYGPPPSSGSNGNGGRMSISVTSPHTLNRYPSMSGRGSSPPLKRPLSPNSDEHAEGKRQRIGSMSSQHRRHSSHSQSNGRPTPTPSTRPSPIPFRQQPTSHSPEMRQAVEPSRSFPPSPSLPTTLPPHPRPIGVGHAAIPLPPMATRSPPDHPMEDARAQSRSSHGESPPRNKRDIVVHTAGSPQVKGTPSPHSSNGRSS